jgi:hypothetical protein
MTPFTGRGALYKENFSKSVLPKALLERKMVSLKTGMEHREEAQAAGVR